MALNKLELDDSDVFYDGEDIPQSSEGAVTYGQLVLMAIKRVMEQGSKEMRGGYVEEKETKHGLRDVYVEDQKKVYMQSIQTLYDALLRYQDEEFRKADDKFRNRLIEIEQEAVNALKLALTYVTDNRLKQHLENQIATKHLDSDSFEAKRAADETLEAYRYLFQQLMLLYARCPLGTGTDIYD